MPDWTEQALKSAASWKAFKEGKSLLDAGMVAQSKSTPDGWTGSVRQGSKLIRLGVKVPKPGDFQVKCSCPENQASGAVCAHAVATGLALLGAASTPTAAKASSIKTPAPAPKSPPSGPLVPLTIRLAPNWSGSFARGKLTVTLAPDPTATADPADAFVTAWVTQLGVPAIKGPLPLSLADDRLTGFLAAALDHPRIFAGKEPFTLTSDATLPISAPVREGDSVILPVGTTPLLLGAHAWLTATDSISRIGPQAVPDDLLPAFTTWSTGKPARVPLKQLLRRAPVWEDWLALPEDSWLGDLRMIPAEPTFHLELEGSLTRLEARLTVRYPETLPLVPGSSDDSSFPRAGEGGRWEVRHFQAEAGAIATLTGLGFAEDTTGRFTLAGEPSVLRFFAHGLSGLPSGWTVEQTPRLRAASATVEVVRPRFEVIGSGEDWLAFDYGFETSSGQLVSRAEVLQWLRSGRGTRQANGRKQVLDEESVLMLEPLLSELDVRQEHGHFVGPKAIEELVTEFRKNRSKIQISSNIDISDTPLPTTLAPEVPELLRPYQRKGISWLVDRLRRFGGALLADDMGLGKTLQTIAVLEQLFADPTPAEGPALVIAPTSLLRNWRAEFQRFAPGRTVRILHGSNRDTERGKVTPQDVVVTSYGTLARDLAWHLQREYKGIAVDEASLMRNPDTDHAKAIAKLRGRHRIALSGTPVENGVRDLWSIFRFIQPGWLGSREQFKEHYEAPLQAAPVPKAPMERLRLKTAPFILRRTKEQVASDLPSKLIIDDYCELSADQRQIYRDLVGEGGKRVDEIREKAGTGAARMQMLTALLRLRQTCCDLGLLKNERLDKLPIDRRSAKLERLLERVDEAVSGNHRILVFSQFQTQLQKIREQLEARQVDTLLLDGQTRNRQDLVDRFQKPDGPPVFLISLKAGGYGLNLTAADTVIHFDPWWNPAAEAQATDRAHRIGQTRPVTVYRLLTRGTVEEKVVRLQATKRELAQAAFDESGFGEATGWSDKELTDLLRG